MAWTDDRVARLSKLWAEGLSASQIAADLGEVTRNAVIGKVHRLGLSGRVKTNTGGRTKSTATRTNGYTRTTRSSAKTNKSSTSRGNGKTTAAQRVVVEDLVAPEPKKIKLIYLTEATCKWPIGDPQDEDFCFCGHGTKEETPYCEYHCKLAYQPIADRRRSSKANRAGTTR